MGRTTVSDEGPASAGDASLSLFYAVDSQDRIIDVGGAWDDFALENDGKSVLRERILGTPVFKHVNGDVSAMYLRTLLSSVRMLGKPVTRCYRCDSPGTKRYMEMTLTPDAEDGVLIAHRLLRTENLPARFIFTVAKGKPSYAVRCSMCNRLKKDGEWQEPDELWAKGGWADAEPKTVIYGVCDTCMTGVRGAEE